MKTVEKSMESVNRKARKVAIKIARKFKKAQQNYQMTVQLRAGRSKA